MGGMGGGMGGGGMSINRPSSDAAAQVAAHKAAQVYQVKLSVCVCVCTNPMCFMCVCVVVTGQGMKRGEWGVNARV